MQMYEEFVREFEKTREAFRAERHAELERWRKELDERFGKIPEEFDVMRLGQQRGLGKVTGAIENDRQVTREMIEDLREHRDHLIDIRHGVQANTAGLLHVLAELRRENGEEPAGA
jgi:hypothetical protein